jgi:hypothetical protein
MCDCVVNSVDGINVAIWTSMLSKRISLDIGQNIVKVIKSGVLLVFEPLCYHVMDRFSLIPLMLTDFK